MAAHSSLAAVGRFNAGACEQSPQSWPRSGVSRRPGSPCQANSIRHMRAA